MKYEELYDEFKKLFPEYADYFKAKEEETGAEVEIGMHVVFGMVVCPFIIKMAEEEPKNAQMAFDFVEQMLTSENSKIFNVAEVTVLEDLMTEDNGGFRKLGRYLGEESLKSVRHLSQFFDIQMK